MNCLPVIEMEMRSAARRAWTFRLRLLFFMAGALACLIVLLLPNFSSATKGRTMLVLLSFLGLAYCLGVGGFLTADCVSSEKRGGTLGLLLLTPLSGMDIVLGKLVCHGLQIFYGVCAVFPVFFLPLLVGGVTWGEVTRILTVLTVALLLAPAIGVFVSVLGTESRKTMMTTFSTVFLLTALPFMYFVVRTLFFRSPAGGLAQLSPVFTVLSGFDSNYRMTGGPGRFWGSVAFLICLSLVSIVAAGMCVGRMFEAAKMKAAAEEAAQVRFRRPRLSDVNPFEWLLSLQSPKTRSPKLLSYLIVLVFSAMLVVSLSGRFWAQGFISAFFTALVFHLVAKLWFTVEATWQINADRQSGALELVLVSELSEASLLEGYLHTLQAIARKPLLTAIGLNVTLVLWMIVFSQELHLNSEAGRMFAILFISGSLLAAADFSALRWMSLVKGLRASSHPRAVLLTFSSVMVPPWIGMGLVVAILSSMQPNSSNVPEFVFLIWVVFCLAHDWRIVQNCRTQLEGKLRSLASEASG